MAVPRPRVRLPALARFHSSHAAHAHSHAASAAVSLPPAAALLNEVREVIRSVDEATQKGSNPWIGRLDAGVMKVQEREAERARGQREEVEIVVYSPPYAGAPDLIAALLEDPLASPENARLRKLLRRRRDPQTQDIPLRITYGPEPRATEGGGLSLNSDFLQKGNFSLLELPPHTPAHQALATLLLAPLPVLLLDNLRLLSLPSLASTIPSLLRHPNLRIVVNSIADLSREPGEQDRIWDELLQWNGGVPIPDLVSRVHFLDAEKALVAIDAYREAPGDVDAVNFFSKEFLASNVARLQDDLLGVDPASRHPSSSSKQAVASQLFDSPSEAVSPFIAQSALASATFDLLALSTELDTFAASADSLREHAQVATAEFVKKALVVPPKIGEIPVHASSSSSEQGGAAAKESATEPASPPAVVHEPVAVEVTRKARAEVEAVILRASWPKLMFGGKVDDIGWELDSAVREHWGSEGERLLLLSTGQLVSLQHEIVQRTSQLLHSPPHPTLHSPVLINSLPAVPPVPTSTLLAPVAQRKLQLLSPTGPIASLHARAQRAVLTTYISAAVSIGGGYYAWLAEIAESAATATGVALVGSLVGLRWGVGKWAKGKRRFWQDWKRLEDGLEVDIQSHMEKQLQKTILARSTAATEGVLDLVRRRREVIAAKTEAIEAMKTKVKASLPAKIDSE